MEILSKITTKSVCGSVDFKKLLKWEEQNPGKEMHMYVVFGIVQGMKTDRSDLGEYVKFSGRFKAINALTGAIFVSGAMLLPKIAESLIAGAMQEGSSLEFGLRLSVRYDETAATKYVYTVHSLLATKENDPLAEIEARVHIEAPKALSAPLAAVPTDNPSPRAAKSTKAA